jgi:hypothetical protein
MENKKIKFKIRILLSCIIGVTIGVITFPIVWNNPFGNTTEEINQVENAIEQMFQKQGEIGSVHDWINVEEIISPLVYENGKIAEAKALMHYSDNPIQERLSENIVSYGYLWLEKDEVSQQPWKIQTKLSRFIISLGTSVLSCLGSIISVFLILTFVPIMLFIFISKVWYFLLKRISELSKAIQGKDNS